MGFVSKLCLFWNYGHLVTYPKAYRFNSTPSRRAFVHSVLLHSVNTARNWENSSFFTLEGRSLKTGEFVQTAHIHLWFNSCCWVSWTQIRFLGLPFPVWISILPLSPPVTWFCSWVLLPCPSPNTYFSHCLREYLNVPKSIWVLGCCHTRRWFTF